MLFCIASFDDNFAVKYQLKTWFLITLHHKVHSLLKEIMPLKVEYRAIKMNKLGLCLVWVLLRVRHNDLRPNGGAFLVEVISGSGKEGWRVRWERRNRH